MTIKKIYNYNDLITYNNITDTYDNWRRSLSYTNKQFDARFRKYKKLETILKPNIKVTKVVINNRISTNQLLNELCSTIYKYFN